MIKLTHSSYAIGGKVMLCSSCLSDTLLGKFEKNIACVNPRDDASLKELFDGAMTIHLEGRCSVCNRSIVVGETAYIEENDLIELITKYVGALFTSKIVCCEQCETGDFFSMYRHSVLKSCDDKEEELAVLNDLRRLETSECIEDLISDYFSDDSWLDYYQQIAMNMYCPNCQNGSGIDYDEKIDYGTFDQYTEIYTQIDQNEFNHIFFGDALLPSDDYIDRICNRFTLEELSQIVNDYLDGKSMSPIIQQLEKYIASLFNLGLFVELSPNRVLYRTRKHEENIAGYSSDDLWEAPAGKALQGRYNKANVSVLYIANSIDAIKEEVPRGENEIYSIGKFLINTALNCFPINAVFTGAYADFISKKKSTDKREYILTNLVSPMCEKIGYDGIAYYSTQKKEYVNYAIFCKYTRGKELSCIDTFEEK